jgi:prevent-host-death family protein
MKEEVVAAAEFKAHCLHVLDEVQRTRIPVVVTKRGLPVARIVPFDQDPKSILGSMKGLVSIQGDIVGGTGELWEADADG